MKKPTVFSRVLVLGVLLSLAALAPLRAAVDDAAGLFSANARDEATRRMAAMERTYRKDLNVQTMATLPPEVAQRLSSQGKAVFEEFAEREARARGVNGVYVLIVKSPAHLQAIVGNDTLRQAFTVQDRDRLVALMLERLRARDFDAALLDAVSFVESTYAAHAGNRNGGAPLTRVRREPEGSGFGWLLPLILIGLVVWLVVGFFRSRSAAPPSPFGGSPGYGPTMGAPGGGGFFRSLLGGMLGAGAGMWLYDRFFGGSSAWGAGPQDTFTGGSDPGNTNQGYTGQDTNYSGSGGDFGSGDSGGGSDGGGGFDGGGDSGGGGGGDF